MEKYNIGDKIIIEDTICEIRKVENDEEIQYILYCIDMVD